ncbi:glycosyltransferase [bacterium]|nr:glycosyltransferase [bacterium]
MFEENFKALVSEYPVLANKLSGWLEKNSSAIDETAIDAELQTNDFIKIIKPDTNFIFLLGLGCDNLLNYLSLNVHRTTTIIVIEKNIDVFYKFLNRFDLKDFIRGWQVKFIIGAEYDDFSEQLNQFYFPIEKFQIIKHPARYETNHNYYESIIDKINSYAKTRVPFPAKQKSYRFLLMAGTVGVGWPYILQDVIAGLHKLGHKVRVLHLTTAIRNFEITSELIKNRPDFILLLDAIGFMPQLYEQEKIPYISWFFDNPFNWLKKQHISDYYHIFLWDKSYVDNLKEIGFKNVYYLPLAANPDVFYPREKIDFLCDISFIGSSLYQPEPIVFSDKAKQYFVNMLLNLICENPSTALWDLIELINKKHKISFRIDEPEKKYEFELFVQTISRSVYRTKIIEHLLRFNPWFYGDEGWRNLIKLGQGVYKGKINNRIELPAVYTNSGININITVPQIRNSLSHRAFEIPACKGFVISDYRPEAEAFFKLDKEIVCFKNYKDLRDKISYFLKHPKERAQIAANGYKRVTQEHTYVHRLKKMISVLTE